MPRPPSVDPSWGDHSSTYWPPGWDFARFSTATQDELMSLHSEGELEKLQAGLREALGEDGVAELAEWMFAEEQKRNALKRKENNEPEPVEETFVSIPNWLTQWTRSHRGQEWGFVAIRAACYDDEERWQEFKRQFEAIVRIPFEREKGKADVAEATEKFNIRWIEDSALDGASTAALQERYISLKPSLPPGQFQSVFLCASASVIDSFLSKNSSHPTDRTKYWRPSAPYILAISETSEPGLEEGHEEREWFREVFKVAAEVLVEEFWWVIDSDMTPLRRMTMYIKGVGDTSGDKRPDLEEMWWSLSPSPARMQKRRRW